MGPRETVGVVVEIFGVLWKVVFGQKALQDALKEWQAKRRPGKPPGLSGGNEANSAMTSKNGYPASTDLGEWSATGAGVARLDDLVRDVKDLVALARYEEAVSTAKRHREAMVAVGDKHNPAFQLALGELDVWYAHTQIYVGDTSEAIERLKRVIADLGGQRGLYEALPLGTRR